MALFLLLLLKSNCSNLLASNYTQPCRPMVSSVSQPHQTLRLAAGLLRLIGI